MKKRIVNRTIILWRLVIVSHFFSQICLPQKRNCKSHSQHQSASTGKLRGVGNCSHNISKLTVWILVLVGIYDYYVIFYPRSLFFLCKHIFDSALISSFLDKTKAVVTLNRTRGWIHETLALFLLSDINVLIAVLPEIVDLRIQHSRDVDCSYSTQNHSPSIF